MLKLNSVCGKIDLNIQINKNENFINLMDNLVNQSHYYFNKCNKNYIVCFMTGFTNR